MDGPMSRKIEDTKDALFGLVTIALVIACVVFLAYVLNFRHEKISGDPSDWGVFGDYIGGALNPSFAFFSLFALLITIIHQRQAQEKQDKALYKQNFESSFFQLLKLHNEIINHITYKTNHKTPGAIFILYKGREAFISMNDDFHADFPFGDGLNAFMGELTIERINEIYLGFYNSENNSDQLGHYFRNLYTIMKFI